MPHNTLNGPIMRAHRNSYRRRAGSQSSRLERIEEKMLPKPIPEHTPRDFAQLLSWAARAGGRADELSASYAGLTNEMARLMVEAGQADEITSDDVSFSPERQARWDALTRALDDLYRDLDTMRRADVDAEQESPS